jgi:CRP-like cAMP-binding protein
MEGCNMNESIQAMIQKNLIIYTKYIDIDTLSSIVDLDNPITIPKGKLVVADDEAFFLLSGIFRGFYLDNEGNDITHHFIFENQSYASDFLTTDKPQVCSYEALEECIALSINTKKVRDSIQTNNRLLWLYVHMLEEAMKRKIIRETSFVNKTATERYIDFKYMYPGIEKRVNQIHIASYLGITPVSLSRIRRVIREEN